MKNINNFAKRLRSNEVLTGTLVSLPSPEICELLANIGYDWLFIDAEHGAFNPQQAQTMLQAATPTPCLIRVPADETIWLKKALDIGAAGVIVPQVHNATQAKKIITNCKYAPAGDRGIGIGRAHKYGIDFERYLKNANEETAVVLQAESSEAVENINAIVALEGVDAILIGPYDLSASMGITSQFEHVEFLNVMKSIKKKADLANMPCGIHVVDPSVSDLKERIAEGYRFIAYSIDSVFLTRSSNNPIV